MSGKLRRVLTGQKSGGRAFVAADGQPPAVFPIEGTATIFEVWKSAESPVRLHADSEEPAAGPLSLAPPPNGTIFRIVDIAPSAATPANPAAAKRVFEQMNAGHASTQTDSHSEGLMHRTATLDYGIVIDGSITLAVDDGEVQLEAGDVVVQRGANHAWINRSGRNCRMAFVMIDAKLPE
jgi:hypothetical protein